MDEIKNNDELTTADSETTEKTAETANNQTTENNQTTTENNELKAENKNGENEAENSKKSFFARHGKKILAYALCFLAGIGVFWSGWLTHYFSQNERIRSIDFFLNNYDKYYFETRDGETEKDVTKIIADAILDKYSEYYTAEEYAAETKSSRGEKKGLGLTFLSEDFSIYSVSGNSPAEKGGVKAGGKVCGYKFSEGEEYFAVSGDKKAALNDFISKSNASADGLVFLKIDYGFGGEQNIKEFRLQKAEYNESYVYYADQSGYYGYSGDNELSLVSLGALYGSDFGFDGKTGYIKLTQFNGLKSGTLGGGGQFKGALEMFKKNRKTQLILDLRGNGGGFMSILCDIASYLCDFSGSSALCQKAVDKNGNVQLFNMPASKYSDYGFEKIVVLADENSASASEALIGAMLDYDKKSARGAVCVILSPSQNEKGETVFKSYGKGIMQSTYLNPLSGEAVKLTTAKIKWPVSEICIHGKGVTADLNSSGYNVICGSGDGISDANEYFAFKNKTAV